MRREQGSARQTLGRKNGEPRAFSPGVPERFAQIRQAKPRGGTSGDGRPRVSAEYRTAGVSGDGVPNG